MTIKIAIVGAGLVGSFTAVLLSRLPDVELHVYESSPVPHEVGAWIAITNSSFQLLSQVIPIDELNSIVYRGTPPTSVTRHWQSGDILYVQPQFSTDVSLVEARTHRVPLHQLILKYVPERVIHYNHKVSSISRDEYGAKINFESHPPETADLVVAADGIYSKIRQQIYPNPIEYKGLVAYRGIFPMSLIKDIKVPNDTSSWISPKGHVMFMSGVGLDMYGIVALVRQPWGSNLKWDRDDIDKDFVMQIYQDWDPAVTSVLKVAMPYLKSYPLETSVWCSKLFDSDLSTVLVGDAAHPTAGAYGAGSSFGFADSWALYRSLQETRDLNLMMKLYNSTRLPFLKRVEKQMTIDRDVAKLTNIKWEQRVKISLNGGDWIKNHNVELEFQKIRDENLVEIITRI